MAREIGAYLPRFLFPPGLEPGIEGWQQRGITVTDDRVGREAVSGNLGNQREWVELDPKGNLTGRWKLDPRDDFRGVVLTSDNHVYVHRYDPKAKVRRMFVLNRTSSTWDPVDGPNAALYGADGNKLVFAHWVSGAMHMRWYSQPQVSTLSTGH